MEIKTVDPKFPKFEEASFEQIGLGRFFTFQSGKPHLCIKTGEETWLHIDKTMTSFAMFDNLDRFSPYKIMCDMIAIDSISIRHLLENKK